jgi:hypothetical protein
MADLTHVDIEVPFAYQVVGILKGKRNPTIETVVEFVPFRVPWVWEKDVERSLEFRETRSRLTPLEEKVPIVDGRVLMPVLAWRPGMGGTYANTVFGDHNHAVSLLKAASWVGDVDIQFQRNPLFDRMGIPSMKGVAATSIENIRQVLSDDRDARMHDALEAAATLVFVEGFLHSSAYEPISVSVNGSPGWHTASVTGSMERMLHGPALNNGILRKADDPGAEQSCEGSWLIGDVEGLSLRCRAEEATVVNLTRAWLWEINKSGENLDNQNLVSEETKQAVMLEISECRRHIKLMTIGDRRYEFSAMVDAISSLRDVIDAKGVVFSESADYRRELLDVYTVDVRMTDAIDPEEDSALHMGI